VLLLLFSVVAGCATGESGAGDKQTSSVHDTLRASPAPEGRRTLLFVGTSLTAGLGLDPDEAYPELIQRKIDTAGLAFTVVNAGLSGETSAGALRRVDWLLKRPVDVFVLETGANDGLRGLDVDSTAAHIRAIIAAVRRAGPATRICLVQMEAPPNMGPRYARAFHEIFPAIARSEGVVLLPFLLRDVAGHPSLNQADGMHPNSQGSKLVASTIWGALGPVLSTPSDRALSGRVDGASKRP